eukprot:30186-Eustigmatos_ZCMA.PRE.1
MGRMTEGQVGSTHASKNSCHSGSPLQRPRQVPRQPHAPLQVWLALSNQPQALKEPHHLRFAVHMHLPYPPASVQEPL